MITFDNNLYSPGDAIRVKIDCDNSQCGKVIKSFKIKLKRKIYIQIGSGLLASTYKASSYMCSKQVEGCASKETVQRELELVIPTTDVQTLPKMSDFAKMGLEDPIQTTIHEAMTPTVASSMITVSYSIKVFVRHDALTQFG
jgi:hypothetical protein